MGLGSSHSLELKITNMTQNITLMNPRTYFGLGHCCKAPLPELFPGFSDTCCFSGNPVFWGNAGTTGVSGILVYESESFSLAIYFYNPVNYNKFPMELGLELSPGKAHLGNMGTIYIRMAHGAYSSSGRDIKFARMTMGESCGTAELSYGPIKVMATMSCDTRSTIEVVLEEENESGEEAEREEPQDVQGDRSRRVRILRDLFEELMDSPGSM